MSSPARGARIFGAGGEQAVDDNSIDRAVIAALLRSSKYQVTVVDSEEKAIELLGMQEPNMNLIITYYWMPEMTGYKLLKRIKESSKMMEIPVIIMPSENVPNRINRCLEGVEDFLLKPVRSSDVFHLSS